jgi:hypothetical protein
MLRISALIAVLAVIAMKSNVLATQPQKPANTNGCYSYQQFMAVCKKQGIIRTCERWWEWRRRANSYCVRY